MRSPSRLTPHDISVIPLTFGVSFRPNTYLYDTLPTLAQKKSTPINTPPLSRAPHLASPRASLFPLFYQLAYISTIRPYFTIYQLFSIKYFTTIRSPCYILLMEDTHMTNRKARKAIVKSLIETSNAYFDIDMEALGFGTARDIQFEELAYIARKYGYSREHVFTISEYLSGIDSGLSPLQLSEIGVRLEDGAIIGNWK
jgi:hypothetical protein